LKRRKKITRRWQRELLSSNFAVSFFNYLQYTSQPLFSFIGIKSLDAIKANFKPRLRKSHTYRVIKLDRCPTDTN